MIDSQDSSAQSPNFPIKTVRLSIGFMVLALCAATFFTSKIGHDVRRVMASQIQVLTAAERLEHYGTILELSIRTVVAYGDTEAATRYRRVQPQLRATLQELRQDLDVDENRAAAEGVDRADLSLVAIEQQALELAQNGELRAAAALVGSTRYSHLLTIYYGGIEEIKHRAGAHVAAADAKLNWSLYAVIGLITAAFALIVFGWVALIRPTMRWGRELDEAREKSEHATKQLEANQIELEALNQQLFEQARIDYLTKLQTRLKFYEDIDQLWPRISRYGERYCVVMCDIDNFKEYNDIYGHAEGDTALKLVAEALTASCRGGDQVYRFGGEEFVIVLPRCEAEAGVQAADRYRAAVEELDIQHTGSASGRVTVSMGVAPLDSTGGKTIDTCLNEADTALYRAKRSGRNKVFGSEAAFASR